MKIFCSFLLVLCASCYFIDNEESRRLNSLPTGAMNDSQIQRGGFILYIIGIFYLFLSIQEICSQCFLPTIDLIVAKYSIKQEVAGSTILAIGGSAPEICIMFFGIFLAESNIGHTTILGSGAINGMLLVGLCGIRTKNIVELQWWVVVRDSIFNIILLGFLLLFTFNNHVDWYEGFILLLLYTVYAVFMYFNPIIERTAKKYLNLPYNGDDVNYHPLPDREFKIRRYSISELIEYIPPQLNFKKGVLAKMMRIAQLMVINSHSERVMDVRAKLKNAIYSILQAIEEKKRCTKQLRLQRGVVKKFNGFDYQHEETKDQLPRIRKLESIRTEETNVLQPIEVLASRSKLRMYILAPVNLLIKITVPNIKKHPTLWILSFFSSLIWIGFLTFLLVWWTLELGNALVIPDGILGVLILAAGVSIPDLVNTLKKINDGNGEMALSGCLGSNIINLSFGLGLPWFLYCVINGKSITITRETFNAQIILVCTLTVSYIFIGGFKWQLSTNLGFVMIFFYMLFLLLYLLFEFSQL